MTLEPPCTFTPGHRHGVRLATSADLRRSAKRRTHELESRMQRVLTEGVAKRRQGRQPDARRERGSETKENEGGKVVNKVRGWKRKAPNSVHDEEGYFWSGQIAEEDDKGNFGRARGTSK